eukprot:3158332-Pyramimonas_sp.AAC.1
MGTRRFDVAYQPVKAFIARGIPFGNLSDRNDNNVPGRESSSVRSPRPGRGYPRRSNRTR